MFEHAYHTDYGAAAAYMDAFMTNVNWDECNRRLDQSQRMQAILGQSRGALHIKSKMRPVKSINPSPSGRGLGEGLRTCERIDLCDCRSYEGPK